MDDGRTTVLGKSWGNPQWTGQLHHLAHVWDNNWGILSTMDSNPWWYMHLWCRFYCCHYSPFSSSLLHLPLKSDHYQLSDRLENHRQDTQVKDILKTNIFASQDLLNRQRHQLQDSGSQNRVAETWQILQLQESTCLFSLETKILRLHRNIVYSQLNAYTMRPLSTSLSTY